MDNDFLFIMTRKLQMTRRSFALIIVLCVGSLFCFKLYTNPQMLSTTYSSEFRGRIEQCENRFKNFRSAKEPVVTNVESQNDPNDLMKAGPFKFLPNFKNPCWLNPDRVKNKTTLPVLCLPYFYMVGAPKAGTTDMNRRLIQHPQISSHVQKEPHWLTRKRFWDCSASTLWDNERLSRKAATQNLTELPYTNADIIHHLNPRTKIIVMLRNPVDRLYSDFLYFQHKTPREFHQEVVPGIQHENMCLKVNSTRHCMYKSYYNQNITRMGRLRIGVYYIHLEEYFRVFPRNQIMVIKLEDFSLNQKEYMKRLFKFLDLDPLDDMTLQKIANPKKKANTRKLTDKRVGEMLPETRKLLEDFYRPFNEKLVKLLGDSFNYN